MKGDLALPPLVVAKGGSRLLAAREYQSKAASGPAKPRAKGDLTWVTCQMAIIKTSIGLQIGGEEFEYGPCRNCGVATPMVPSCQSEAGLLCLSCQDQPGLVQGLEAWLMQREADLRLELLQVEDELARLRAN